MKHPHADTSSAIQWKRIEPTIIGTFGRRTIVSKTFVVPGGAAHNVETLSPEGFCCAATIALTPERKVLIARQFRPGPEQFMDEIPGGIMQAGETAEQAARRELLGEVGYAPGKMEYLGHYWRDAFSNAGAEYFLATDCLAVAGAQLIEAAERVEVKLFSIDELIACAKEGRMTDPAAVLLAYETLMKLRG